MFCWCRNLQAQDKTYTAVISGFFFSNVSSWSCCKRSSNSKEMGHLMRESKDEVYPFCLHLKNSDNSMSTYSFCIASNLSFVCRGKTPKTKSGKKEEAVRTKPAAKNKRRLGNSLTLFTILHARAFVCPCWLDSRSYDLSFDRFDHVALCAGQDWCPLLSRKELCAQTPRFARDPHPPVFLKVF